MTHTVGSGHRDPRMSLKIRALRFIFRSFMRWRLEEITAPSYPVLLEYAIRPTPRYGVSRPSLDGFQQWLRAQSGDYSILLEQLKAFRDDLGRIPETAEDPDRGSPFWGNKYFTGIDAIALYGLLGILQPRQILEVGSGNSTRYARRAIRDLGLNTRIVSIDPMPRVEVDALCDEVVRSPLEDVDLSIFDSLVAGDVLFIDNSHVVFENSDATVTFLEVLPRLKPGITIHIHDIFLPYDYPESWAKRHYSEQYLLAAYVLGGAAHLQPVLPVAYLSRESEFASRIDADWSGSVFQRAFATNRGFTGGYPGTSMWLRTI